MPFLSDNLRACANFTIIDDNIVEMNETFIINITAPDHSPETLQVNVTITDEDDSKKVHVPTFISMVLNMCVYCKYNTLTSLFHFIDAVIGFSRKHYYVNEFSGFTNICVQATKALSDNIDIKFMTTSNNAIANAATGK